MVIAYLTSMYIINIYVHVHIIKYGQRILQVRI